MRVVAALVAAVLVLCIAPDAGAADDPAAEIPGVPLPGSITTGRLGGPIIDRVYSIDVPPQRVLAIDMTGASATDFDLYLFDATATTVYGQTGLVAKSTGSTSTESIRYSTFTGGRFYVDLSGFSESEGDYRLTVVVGNDVTPPLVRLTLDGGAPATNNRDVIVSLVATDDLAGVAEMQFSSDGVDWDGWQPYRPSLHRVLSDADSEQRIWVRVRDRQNNVSVPASASIALDRVPPAVLSLTPEPGSAISASKPRISVRFSEPVLISTWQSSGLRVQDPAGTLLFGTFGWDPATNTGTFAPGSDLSAGVTYIVSVGPVTDVAGNALMAIGSWTLRSVQSPIIVLTANPRVVSPRGSIVLSGSTDLSPGGTFTLERLVPGGAWEPIEPLLPDPTGAFYSRQVVVSTASYRVAYAGNEVSAPATSPGVRVLVRRVVTLIGPGPSVVRSASVGVRVAVTAQVSPAAPQASVTITLSRRDPIRRSYRVIAEFTRVTTNGRASFGWRALTAGTYSIRLTTAATAQFAAGSSASYRWSVR